MIIDRSKEKRTTKYIDVGCDKVFVVILRRKNNGNGAESNDNFPTVNTVNHGHSSTTVTPKKKLTPDQIHKILTDLKHPTDQTVQCFRSTCANIHRARARK